jgi:hypothetical protein
MEEREQSVHEADDADEPEVEAHRLDEIEIGDTEASGEEPEPQDA